MVCGLVAKREQKDTGGGGRMAWKEKRQNKPFARSDILCWRGSEYE